jgi:hypothetical protein
LNNQTNKNFDLFIWNNNPDKQDILDFGKKGAVGYSVYIHNSDKNVYGFGRFILANKLFENKLADFSKKEYDKVMFFDDDERLYEECIEFFSKNYEKNSYKGHWAFKIFSKYSDRHKCGFGENADYIGTGGCVLDPYVFSTKDFIKSVPKEYYCVEDIALTLFCKKIGYKTTSLGKIVPRYLEFIKDSEGLFRKLKYNIKDESYDVLKTKYGA